MSPFFYKVGKISGPFGGKIHLFARSRMLETEGFGVKHLTRTKGKTVLNVLAVFLGGQPFQNLHSTVLFIGKEGMSNVLHMYTNLVCTAGLEAALDKGAVRESLKDFVVGDGFLGGGVVLKVPNAIDGAVAGITSESAFHGSAVLLKGAPDKGIVGSAGGVVEELYGQIGLGFGRFGQKEQTAGIFIYSVNKAYVGIVDIESRIILQVVSHGIEQSAGIVAATG